MGNVLLEQNCDVAFLNMAPKRIQKPFAVSRTPRFHVAPWRDTLCDVYLFPGMTKMNLTWICEMIYICSLFNRISLNCLN
jgi:hypothetical protein